MDEQVRATLTAHAKDMLAERSISEEWVWRTIRSADSWERGVDGNLHFTKAIDEMDNRILRVVVNDGFIPNRIVTVFFDRRLRKGKT
ncbi:MAG: DUF4258 domain-containing protein [Chloroflexota bacterium]